MAGALSLCVDVLSFVAALVCIFTLWMLHERTGFGCAWVVRAVGFWRFVGVLPGSVRRGFSNDLYTTILLIPCLLYAVFRTPAPCGA